MEQVGSVLELNARYFMHGNCYRSWNLSSKCLPYPHQHPGEMKILCIVDSACAQQWPESHACSTYHHLSAAFLSHILTDDKSWMCLTISWSDRMVTGMPQCHQVRKLHGTVRVLWKSCMSCFSAKMDLCSTISCQLVWQSVENITAHSCRIRSASTTSLLSRSRHMWLLGVCMCERTSAG